MSKRKRGIQEGLKDCGPACLYHIIEHYHGHIELEELKEWCCTDKSGTSAYHLIEAAKKCGFQATGLKLELGQMHPSELIFPMIAHVILRDSYYHFLVIEKMNEKSKKIQVYDPATGKRTYSYQEFSKIYQGVVIQLYPIHMIPHNAVYNTIDFIKEILNPIKKQIAQIVILSFTITILSILTTFYFQIMTEHIGFSKMYIISIFLLFLVINLYKTLSSFFRNRLLMIMNQKIDFFLTSHTFEQLVLLPYGYYRNHTTGEMISRIHELENVRNVISKFALLIFIDFPLTIFAFLVMYFLSPTPCMISLILLGLYALIALLFHKPIQHHIDACQNEKAYVTSYMVESIEGFESVRGSNMQRKILNNFQHKYLNFLNKVFRLDGCYNIQLFLKDMIGGVGFLVFILVGVFLVKKDILSIGTLITLQMLLNYFLEPIEGMIDFHTEWKQASIALHKVMKMFHKQEKLTTSKNHLNGNIEIKHLSYDIKEYPILKDISLKIEAKDKIMVVGNSGGGKSTLFKLLKKYYPVPRGKIKLDDIDIQDCEVEDIVYISQDEILFTDTIANNIDSDRMFEIAKICEIDTMIDKLPLGYHTLLEENGFNISGGERQRLILARALARPFSILIIDEGLSQVDVDMERKILKNIFEAYPDKTIIMISHRMDNLDLFDKRLHIEEGKVISYDERNTL